MSDTLAMNEHEAGDAMVVAFRGRLDATASPDAEERLSRLIGDGHRHLVIDLGDLEYISSSGLRVMLAALKRLKQEEGSLSIAGISPGVWQVFVMAGFDRIFEIFDDETAAVEARSTRDR
ncbi:MAG: STAS domain-containing protein [Methanomicrobiales archaeon]